MHRTQVTLTDTQYMRLQEESKRSGHSLAELVRRALDQRYEEMPQNDRLHALDRAFGGWVDRREDGAEFVEQVRTGTTRRLRRPR